MISARALALLPLSLLLAAPALSQAPACGAMDADLPAAFAGWGTPGDVKGVDGGRPVRVALAGDTAFAVAPERVAKPGSFGAVAPFAIAKAGTYEIALSAGAWIDLLADGKTVRSRAHRHGPPCTTIRKIVTFHLPPGAHVMQISGSPADAVTLAIVPVR